MLLRSAITMSSSPGRVALAFGVMFLLGACSSVTDGGNDVHGGPEHPARDGSYTEAIVSPAGIASLEPVTLGGVEQWLLIRGHDVANPVLVKDIIGDGPGRIRRRRQDQEQATVA